MLFTNIDFILFFISLIFLLLVCQKNLHRKLILLCANYFFYACWDYRFLALIIAQTTSEFFLSRALHSSNEDKTRKFILVISIICNVSILIYFKYLNWLIESFSAFFSSGQQDIHFFKIILPLGISFYTFRLLTYSVDIYKKKIVPTPSILDFAIYVSFFPIIISGPIAKASEVLPQIKNINVNLDNVYSGFRLFIIGAFLKIFVADQAGMFVNFYYNNYSVFNTLTAWLATMAYSLQIYSDFAGYSSMAIGISWIMGIRLNDNFDHPYMSGNIKEFWKRWHISLSTWIRDYIYIPLGGNRKSRIRKYFNLVFTMTLCGLWHGAGFNYIFWGFLHGIYIVSHDLFINIRKGRPLRAIPGMILTYISVSFAWVFFRAESFDKAILIIKKLISYQNGVAWYPPFIVFILIVSVFVIILNKCKIRAVSLPLNAEYTLFVLLCMLWLTIVFCPKEFQPFVYAQF